ncbi:MAG: molybdenum cofactor guanylyltransferase [Flavobacteriales bacterium]|nr:molybdenum cofactor guanylyltransferase [Flavobacteriales bacterium]
MELETFILAGGKSTRMGSDKGLLLFNGKPMVSYSISLASHFSKSITIISSNAEYSNFDANLLSDELKNIGPMGGIYTALLHCKTENVLILTVDSPFVSSNLIDMLVKSHNHNEVSYLEHKTRIYPLTAIYRKASLQVIKQQIDTGNYKVRDCFNNLRSNSVEVDVEQSYQLTNINTLNDLKTNESNR